MKALPQSLLGRAQSECQLGDATRHAHRRTSVSQVVPDLAANGRDGEGRKVVAPLAVETVDRFDEADAPDLDEVLEVLATICVPARDAADERQVELDEPLA